MILHKMMNKGIWNWKHKYEINKGIWLGCGIVKADLLNLPDINTIFIPHGNKSLYFYVKKNVQHIKHFIVHIQYDDWKARIDQMDAEYYYVDEPYIRGLDGMRSATVIEEKIMLRLIYIQEVRPESKLVIGDIRHILKSSYTPIPGVYYTYTSYISTFMFFGIPVATGLPNQSRSIKRLSGIVGADKIPFIWVFGKNKWFCYPDEYRQLTETCEQLNIDMQVLYMNTGTELQEICPGSDTFIYVDAFIKGVNAYNFWTWWKRFFISVWVLIKFVFNKS